MLYAILCYNSEDEVFAWPKEHEAEVMARLAKVQERMVQAGKLGPVARLMPTSAATTLRKGDKPLVLDGPFAETKEQLGGYYEIEVADLDTALDWAARCPAAATGAVEVRPNLVM
jgi:hypothetical protein